MPVQRTCLGTEVDISEGKISHAFGPSPAWRAGQESAALNEIKGFRSLLGPLSIPLPGLLVLQRQSLQMCSTRPDPWSEPQSC